MAAWWLEKIKTQVLKLPKKCLLLKHNPSHENPQ
jgi:hypothetical protein